MRAADFSRSRPKRSPGYADINRDLGPVMPLRAALEGTEELLLPRI